MVEKWIKALIGFLVLLFVIGCGGIDKSLTDKQQEQSFSQKLIWADKAINLAKSHGVAYQVMIKAGGKPSVGMTNDFYLNTDIEASVTFFGNGAAARNPD